MIENSERMTPWEIANAKAALKELLVEAHTPGVSCEELVRICNAAAQEIRMAREERAAWLAALESGDAVKHAFRTAKL